MLAQLSSPGAALIRLGSSSIEQIAVNGEPARRACTLLQRREAAGNVDNITPILKLAATLVGLARDLVKFAKAYWLRKKEDRQLRQLAICKSRRCSPVPLRASPLALITSLLTSPPRRLPHN